MENFGPVNSRVPHMLHGGDYNPDQWQGYDGVIDEDMRLMKLAGCNVMAVNIFGWTACEPEEGKFTFEWLDKIFDKLYENGVYVILATPSGARPAWMSQKYPEVLRVNELGVRNYHGRRHNHCFTSKIYREKVHLINTMLAKRYKDHPALIAWHVSNEYGGECYCESCQEAFRRYLQEKYGDLETLNKAWWTGFWSHTYTDWSQIDPPSQRGETSVHGLNLDWKRFRTYQTILFYENEIEPLRKYTPHIPITTNFDEYVNTGRGIDYWEFAPHVDVISWDNYPYWHGERPNWVEGARRGFIHDINRSLKHGKPFMMMESSPSATNWQPVAKLRRPGMHELASIQAIAHGSDSVQYFQWRKGLGSSEKFHGAVVDHFASDKTRVFQEVSRVGEVLKGLDNVVGTSVKSEVAIIYDWDNMWALNDAEGFRREKKDYFDTVQSHYQSFWNMGIPCDIIDMRQSLEDYKLVVAPMLYMVKAPFAKQVRQFVSNGGRFVTGYLSGIVNETDLCFTNGRPGPLKEVLGIWSEEIDALYDGDENHIVPNGEMEGISGPYTAKIFCDLIHLEGAKTLATYSDDFYEGMPALTENTFGEGKAYYITFRSYDHFLNDFFAVLASDLKLVRAIDAELPTGVTAQVRYDEEKRFIFLQNYADEVKNVDLGMKKYRDILSGEQKREIISMQPYSFIILSPLT